MASLKVRLGFTAVLAATMGVIALNVRNVDDVQNDAILDTIERVSHLRPEVPAQDEPQAGLAGDTPPPIRDIETTDALGAPSIANDLGFALPLPGADPDRLDNKTREQIMGEAYDLLIEGDYAGVRLRAQKLANENNPEAQHLLGYLFERGLGVEQNLGKALELYGAAAAYGNVDAILALGDLAFNGEGVGQDYGRAMGWYRLGVEKGDARAKARLGAMYADGLGAERDMKKALKLFNEASAENEPEALFSLGFAYLNGFGVPQDHTLAAEKFKAAADLGHGPAAYQLALLHDSPLLGEPDVTKAADYLKKSASVGHPPAFTALGLFAHRGDAPGKAADWFEKAALAGDPQGKFFLAVSNAKGDGRPRNDEVARRLAREVINDPYTDESLKANATTFLLGLDQDAAPAFTLRN